MLPSLRMDCLHNLFGILLPRIVSSSLFIYSILLFYQHGFMDIYCVLWVIMQWYWILLLKLLQLWPLGALSVGFHAPCTHPHACMRVWFCLFLCFICLFLVLAFPWFLALQDALGSSCLFVAPIVTSLKSSGSFYWRIVIRKQDVRAYFKDSYRFLRPGSF